jgi:hypothetical protein
MSAVILPDADDVKINPAAAETLAAAKRELHTRPADVNDAASEFNQGNEAGARDALANESRMPTRTAQIAAGDAPAKAKPPPAAQKPAAEETYDGAEAPELRGKSTREIAREYRALHRQIGVQGAELGALRRRADMLTTLTQHAPRQEEQAPTQPAEVDEIEYFADPKTAVDKAVASHPVMQSLKTAAQETLHRKVSETLGKEFPDHAATLADPEFRKYVSASPVRMALLKQAHQGYSLEAARELFGTWRALKGPAAPTSEKPADTKPATKAASAKSAASGDKRIFRRSEVIALMQNDPEKYEKLSPAIQKAYEQGRVK